MPFAILYERATFQKRSVVFPRVGLLTDPYLRHEPAQHSGRRLAQGARRWKPRTGIVEWSSYGPAFFHHGIGLGSL